MSRFGISQSDWDRAKFEARNILIQQGRLSQPEIFYSTLAARLLPIVKFDPHSLPFFSLLDEISREENDESGCMLSVFVVTKETGHPGKGFYDLARALGRDWIDKDMFWLEERSRAVQFCREII